jgi:hypothetical protein
MFMRVMRVCNAIQMVINKYEIQAFAHIIHYSVRFVK